MKKLLLILALFILFFDRFNKQLGMVKDEVLDASLLYNPIRIQAEQFYPNVLEEFERQKESLEDMKENELF